MQRLSEGPSVVTFDTNVLIRILVGDDPAQTRRAERLFRAHADGDGIYVPSVVLAEIAWVLSAGYDLDRTVVHERLSKLVRTRGVFVEDMELTLAALSRYAAGGAEFADQLMLGKALEQGATPLYTFDRRLGREEYAEAVR
jgi:predicted nucleic-acid-binding protein